jgi:hypothetical protein
MLRTLLVTFFGAALAIGATAQELRFLYPAPPPGTVTISRDVTYGTVDGTALKMDVYRSSRTGARGPALIFFNVASGPQRGNAFYAGWAQAAASRGLVGIVPDLRAGQPQDFHMLVRHLTEHAADYGVDVEALAVYAGSGNVSTALPIVHDPQLTSIKAAVMYYGTGSVKEFRRDLPMLYVRAGLDRPDVNRRIDELTALAIAQNAPVTFLNHPAGHHAFELFDDDDATRQVIDRTLEFVKHATLGPYQAAMRRALPEATAAAHVQTGNYRQAATEYGGLVAARPDDARLRLAFGEALLGDAQYERACAEFEKLKGKGLGPRDLGLPAARACMQKGDPETATQWLKTIPPRFLPADVQNEEVFSPLRNRPEFLALFQQK